MPSQLLKCPRCRYRFIAPPEAADGSWCATCTADAKRVPPPPPPELHPLPPAVPAVVVALAGIAAQLPAQPAAALPATA